MSSIQDEFINLSSTLLSQYKCNKETIELIQQKLIALSIFLAENNIKGLDPKFVPAHLLNQYDTFAYEIGELSSVNELFTQMSDEDIDSLRELCESLAVNLNQQRVEQAGLKSSKERQESFIKNVHHLLSHHKIPEPLSKQLEDTLLELSQFMIKNHLRYIDLSEWSKEFQQDFERYADRFDFIIENNIELQHLNDEQLHQLLHFCELYSATEISLLEPTFEDLAKPYLSEDLKTEISNYLTEEGLSSKDTKAVIGHFEKLSLFMKKHNIKEVRLDLAPDNLKDDFNSLIEEAQAFERNNKLLKQAHLKRLYQFLEN